jgi:tetratricopeptide (TPR) repeat protein
MTDNKQPNTREEYNKPGSVSDGPSAPPRILWIGIAILIASVVVGSIAGVVLFREVFLPSQQQRVVEAIPFMRAFLRPTPMGGILPTVAPGGDEAALALLVQPLATQTPGIIATELPPTPETPAPTVATATAEPSKEPAVITVSPTPTPAQAAIPPSYRLGGISFVQQKWNNCGPANITMALSYFGWQNDQDYAASYLRPNREDKNVGPDELAEFVRNQTAVLSIVRSGGTIDLIRQLVANDFPVVIETGAMFEAYDWIGHYRTTVAYDDVQQQFYFYDSFLGSGAFGEGVAESYLKTDALWRAFNRTFLVVYAPSDAGRLMSILGEWADEENAFEIALAQALDEARTDPRDAFAWFNMGTSLTKLGRYQEAAQAFDQARRLELPWRMLWYQHDLFRAYYEVGRYDDVTSLARITLNNAEELEEAYYWLGRVQEAQGKVQQAASFYNTALRYNPNYADAREAVNGLR